MVANTPKKLNWTPSRFWLGNLIAWTECSTWSWIDVVHSRSQPAFPGANPRWEKVLFKGSFKERRAPQDTPDKEGKEGRRTIIIIKNCYESVILSLQQAQEKDWWQGKRPEGRGSVQFWTWTKNEGVGLSKIWANEVAVLHLHQIWFCVEIVPLGLRETDKGTYLLVPFCFIWCILVWQHYKEAILIIRQNIWLSISNTFLYRL